MQSIWWTSAWKGWRRNGVPFAENEHKARGPVQKDWCQWSEYLSVVQIFEAKTWRWRYQMEFCQIFGQQKRATSRTLRTNHITKEHCIENWWIIEINFIKIKLTTWNRLKDSAKILCHKLRSNPPSFAFHRKKLSRFYIVFYFLEKNHNSLKSQHYVKHA